MRKWIAVLVIALAAGTACFPADAWVEPLVVELEWMEDTLLEAAYFCSLAVLAPTVIDQHVLAQRVVNILEGTEGPNFDLRVAVGEGLAGVLPKLQSLLRYVSQQDLPPEEGKALRISLASIRVFLTLAHEAALRGVRAGRLAHGTLIMRTAYAHLVAALAPPELAYLGGVRPLLARLRAGLGGH